MESHIKLFDQVCNECSTLITKRYSTSFSLAIRTLDKKYHEGIYGIYGFVRFADEIVDTFQKHDREYLLKRFKEDTYDAIERGLSLNPVLHAFQKVVCKYDIGFDLIDAFLESMAMDLDHEWYGEELYKKYIFGSAEVVGLMCVKVFVEGDSAEYERLKSPAKSLGSAFQKVNFLRDMKSDYYDRGRVYFPGVSFSDFSQTEKDLIEADIQKDFDLAYSGILALPMAARFGVYTAYKYYTSLFNKIKETSIEEVLEQRIRIPNNRKFLLLVSSAVRHRLNMI